MGDGHHAWAAAEWLMITRNAFLREEGDRLVVGGGLLERWLADGSRLSFGPAPTRFGTASVLVEHATDWAGWCITVSGHWFEEPPRLLLRPIGAEVVVLDDPARWQAGREGALSVEVKVTRSRCSMVSGE